MKITFESDSGHTVVWEIPGDDDENLKQILNLTGCARVFKISRDSIAHRVYRRSMPILLALSLKTEK